MISGILITIALELLLPLCMGLSVTVLAKKEDTLLHLIADSAVTGQVILFALFQPVIVFATLKGMELPQGLKIFVPLCILAMIFLAGACFISHRKSKEKKICVKKGSFCIWGLIAFALIAFMMVMSFLYTYTDGDDAYYVAAASDTASSESLYTRDPYTGDATLTPYRYLFAPYPVWIAMLSKASGINTAAMAHSFFPWSMILFSFAVMYLIASELFDDSRRRSVFMFFVSVLVMFGDYSIYSPENFLLARSRQGKAALASFVIPFLVLQIARCIKRFNEKKKTDLSGLLLISVTGFAAALCSTMGSALCLALVSVAALVMMIVYRKVKYPLLMMLASCPGLIFMILYVIKR